MSAPLDWTRDGQDWPHHAASRFVQAAGLRWHVQCLGAGPVLLLVHGTGASSHSWAALAALLAEHYTVLVPDLPGHAFSTLPRGRRLSLAAMAEMLAGLLEAMAMSPRVVVGHSAGAAVLARMCLDTRIAPAAMVSVNGALLPLRGVAGTVWAPMARLLSASSLPARLFAHHARRPARVARLIRETGSRADARSVDLYTRLVSRPAHVSAALRMMAGWDLLALRRDLPGLSVPLLLLVGEADRAVPPHDAERLRALLPAARVQRLIGLGHLAHEEDAAAVAAVILAFLHEESAEDAP